MPICFNSISRRGLEEAKISGSGFTRWTRALLAAAHRLRLPVICSRRSLAVAKHLNKRIICNGHHADRRSLEPEIN
jgi:hypothetical protein